MTAHGTLRRERRVAVCEFGSGRLFLEDRQCFGEPGATPERVPFFPQNGREPIQARPDLARVTGLTEERERLLVGPFSLAIAPRVERGGGSSRQDVRAIRMTRGR